MDNHVSRGPAAPVSAPIPATADLDAADFAEYLRAERERRQVTLEQVADETKIAPGGMYRRAMMRAYAESIGVDREFVLEQFERSSEPTKQESAPTAEAASLSEPPAPLSEPARVSEPPARASRPPAGAARAAWSPKQMAVAGASVLSIAALAILWTALSSLSSAGGPEAARAAVVPAPPAVLPQASQQASAGVATPHSFEARPVPAASAPAIPRAAVAATAGSAVSRPLATDGTLVIESNPRGARVTVNGVGWGHTPLTVRHLEFGSKRVRLTLQNHVSEERGVSLGPDRPTARLNVTLAGRR